MMLWTFLTWKYKIKTNEYWSSCHPWAELIRPHFANHPDENWKDNPAENLGQNREGHREGDQEENPDIIKEDRCHQHFTRNFFVRKCFAQLISYYSLALWPFVKRISAQKLLVKCWWNWLKSGWRRQKACRHVERRFGTSRQYCCRRKVLEIGERRLQTWLFTSPVHWIWKYTFKIVLKREEVNNW